MFLKQVYKGEIDTWRFVLTIVLVIGGYILGQIPITLVSTYYISRADVDAAVLSDFMNTMDFGAIGMDQNLTLFLLLIMFVVAMAALFVGITRIHQRPFKSIWTSRRKVDWGRIMFGFWIWLAITIVLELIGFAYEPGNYIFQFQWKPFLILLVIAVVMLPIQTTFEELFIRGYVMQALSIVSQSRWTPLIGSSVIFGLMHSMNPEVQEYGWSTMMTYYVGIAIFLGVLTLLDNGLELAIGIHTATNMYGALFVTFQDSAIRTPALFRLSEVDPGAMAGYSLGAAIFFLWLAARKYNLLNWKQVYGSVEVIGEDATRAHFNAKKQLIIEKLQGENPDLLLKESESDTIVMASDNAKVVATFCYGPFNESGRMQRPFQLGYFELINRNARDASRAISIVNAVGMTSKDMTFMANRVYEVFLENQEIIYILLLSPEPFRKLKEDGWKISLLEVLEISKEEFIWGSENGSSELLMKYAQGE